jgi:UDP-N-acetyl-D-mannosaminuronate dehydrogenase
MGQSELPKHIGWVGLGLMGMPMATNLLKKMSPDTKFYVFDVMKESVETFVQRGEGRVEACGNSKEVADKSVCSHACRHEISILSELSIPLTCLLRITR